MLLTFLVVFGYFGVKMVRMVRMVRMGTFRHFWLSTVQMVCLVNMRVSSILDGLVSFFLFNFIDLVYFV